MSNLRLFGIIIGIVGLIVTFLWYRGPKWKRSSFILSYLINICLIITCINPNSVNFARDILSLQQYQYGRILALLIFSNIFLLLLIFTTKSKQGGILVQLDKLIRRLGVNDLKGIIAVKDKINPIMVVIPAYNESENLKYLLPKIPSRIKEMNIGTLVVDDGSEDETAEVAREHGHLVVSNHINRGGGAALRLGYDVLKEANAQICVTMDADGQHRPEEIKELVMPILNDQYDFVIGSRILGNREKDSVFRIAGVYFFGFLISSLLGNKITDPSSGYRAFRMDAMDSIRLYEDQYHTSELIIEAIKKGIRIGEVPITILKRKHGKSKKGRDWVYAFHFAKIIFRTWWRAK